MRKKVAEWRAACRKKIAEWRAAYRKKAAEWRAALRKSILEKQAASRKNIERLKACIDLSLSFISHFFVPILIILTTIILFENGDLKNEIGKLLGKIGPLTEEMDKLSEKVELLTDEINNLSGDVKLLTGKMGNLSVKVESLADEMGNLSGRVSILTGSVNSLYIEQKELQAEIHTQPEKSDNTKIDDPMLNNRLCSVERKVKCLDDKIEEHNRESKEWQECVTRELEKNPPNFPNCDYEVKDADCLCGTPPN